MKIFNRLFVFPILIHNKIGTVYGDKPDLTIRWRKSGMAGTVKFTSYTLQIVTKTKEFQWSFVWRPDVTRHYWLGHHKRSQVIKQSSKS